MPAAGGCCCIPHTDAENHNGGQLQFGPDGKLWLGPATAAAATTSSAHAQDPASLLGKLIRLDAAAPAPEVGRARACATRGASRSIARAAS